MSTAPRVKVLATGTVMVDVLAVDLPAIAAPGHVVYSPLPIETRIGGHPVDVAIDLVKLGYSAHEVGVVVAVGNGLYGQYVRREMSRFGIRQFVEAIDQTDTGTTVVLKVKDEDRRFHLDPGANWHLSSAHVEAAVTELAPEVLCLRPGYTGIDEHVEGLLARASESTVFLDLMQPHPARAWNFLHSALPHANIVHCNEVEARFHTGTQDIDEAVAVLMSTGIDLLLLSRGGEGARVITSEHDIAQPAFDVSALDTTGCGDALCAGVIYWLLEQKAHASVATLTRDELADMLMFGQAVGASAATAIGCVEGVACSTVSELLRTQSERVRGHGATGVVSFHEA